MSLVIHFNTILCFLICFLIQSSKHFIGETTRVLSNVYIMVDEYKEEMIVEYTYESQKENFEHVDSIDFSADITNEEAMVLQLLKEKQGKRLIGQNVAQTC